MNRHPHPDAPNIKLALCDDAELTRAGLQVLLAPYRHVELGPAQQTPPADITLFDTEQPLTQDFVEQFVQPLAARPETGRLVLYSWSRPLSEVRMVLGAGVRGFLPKSLPGHALVRALERTFAGDVVVLRAHSAASGEEADEVSLTRREAQILELIAAGLSNHEIVTLTDLSLNTVKSYIRSAYRKAGVTSRSQAVAWALRSGLARPTT